MIIDDLIQLAQNGESDHIEFKKTTGQLRAGMKTLCAFLNGQGGHVLFGVIDSGELRGQVVSSKTLEDIAREFKRLDPAISPLIDVVKLDNGQSIIAITAQQAEGPYTYDGRPYERVGAVTSIMPRTVYEGLLLERLHPTRRWENQPVPENITIDSLDTEEIETVLANDDRLEISSPGEFHFGLSAEKMIQPHESRPWNPLIANTFYRAGVIERWGSGTTNMIHWCKENGNPIPQWRERNGSVIVSFSPPATPQVTPQVEKLVQICLQPYSRDELQQSLKIQDAKYFRETYLQPALTAGIIELTLPDKPRSPLQKYKLTQRGRSLSGQLGNAATPQATPQVTPQAAPLAEKLLQECLQPHSRDELQQSLKIQDVKYFRETYLRPALSNGLIELTIPHKPNSPLQKYKLTDKGRIFIEQRGREGK